MKTNRMTVYVDGSGPVELTDRNYLASGGQGTIYVRQSQAFKIYHEPTEVIPPGKLSELSVITDPRILKPEQFIRNIHGQPIGITMRYVKNLENLCKLFSATWKLNNSISNQDVVDFVERLFELICQSVHPKGVVIGDLNELNFLIDQSAKNVYGIDCDSYHTPSYPCTVIMETVRDRKFKSGQFSVQSDYFSMAVVSFQMYVGIHPYKGRHPKYKMNEWQQRMQENASVFDTGVTLPPSCLPFSVIPRTHLEWYKRVFQKGVRDLPPPANGVVNIAAGTSTRQFANFNQQIQFTRPGKILMVYYLNNEQFVKYDTFQAIEITQGNNVISRTPKNQNPEDVTISRMDKTFEPYTMVRLKHRQLPPVCSFRYNDAEFFSAYSEEFMEYEGKLYGTVGPNLMRFDVRMMDRPIMTMQLVANVFETTCRLFPGCAYQDIIGKCYFCVFDLKNRAVNIPIPDLNGHRIIRASYSKRVLCVISELRSQYYHHIILFSENMSSYQYEVSVAEPTASCSFTVMDKGICVCQMGDDDLKLFSMADLRQTKTLKDSPIGPNTVFYSYQDVLYYIDNDTVFSVTAK